MSNSKNTDGKKTENNRFENKRSEGKKRAGAGKAGSARNKFLTVWKRVRDRVEEALIWAGKNKKTSIPAVMVIFVVLVALIVTVSSAISSGSKDTTAGTEAVAGTDLNIIAAPEVALEENAVAGVNKLMESYYTALAAGDTAAIEAIKGSLSDTDRIEIEKKSAYIESYDNLKCYTKTGFKADSYLVFAYTEAKFKDVDTAAPSLNSFYVDQNENGEYRIFEGNLDENVMNYLQELSAQDDVTNLCNDVQAKYNEAVDSDEKLKELMDKFPNVIKDEVAAELAAQEAAATESETETKAEEEPSETATEESVSSVKEVRTLDTVNVRKSDSEEADKLGKVEKGTRLTLLEKKENGWSKVTFEGQEAYVKTEFLADVTEDQTQEAASSNEPQGNGGAETSSGSSSSTVGSNGKVMAKETVNVRKTAAENGEKLGVIYQGETLELVMQQADGWCKVKYNGQTGYVKTEFVE